jgi:hypothetical protein
MGANREYKSSASSLLFGEENTLRELYDTLEGVTLPPNLPVTINTLENALFKTKINGISFEAGEKLVVILEHQSTISPNMPLRLLSYIARVYEKTTAAPWPLPRLSGKRCPSSKSPMPRRLPSLPFWPSVSSMPYRS